MWIYLNNRFVSKTSARISVFDWGFLYGDGLFETLRAYNGKIFLLSQHLTRLLKAANQLGLTLPKATKLESLLYETLNRNRLRDAMLRLTMTRGEGLWGPLDPAACKKPTIVIFARPFTGYPSEVYRKGMTASIVTVRQSGGLKSTSFQNHILARREAAGKGMSEAILLTPKGYLAEGSVSNLFWVKKGRLYTPAVSTGILAGITRRLVLDLAQKAKIPTREGSYRPEVILNADEAFLTNTGFEVIPLTAVDQKKIGSGRPGSITKKILQAFQKEIQ
jgi:branched-chain amino acid aminotransferase